MRTVFRYSPSDLRDRAVIQSLAPTTNANFEEVLGVTDVATVQGQFRPRTGDEAIRSDQVQAVAEAIFAIRYRDWVTTEHQLVLRGDVWQIHSIVDVDARRRYMELLLSRAGVSEVVESGEEGEAEGESEGGE